MNSQPPQSLSYLALSYLTNITGLAGSFYVDKQLNNR
jgi:hypothetical protein